MATAAAPRLVAARGIMLLGAFLIVSMLVQVLLLVEFWPVSVPTDTTAVTAPDPSNEEDDDSPPEDEERGSDPAGLPDISDWSNSYELLGLQGTISPAARIIVLVLIAGGVGGMLHCLRSFRAFVGNRQLSRSWIWWYLLRPFEGSIVALVFYFVVQGGLGTDNGIELSTVYVITGISALVGMFSEQAVEKLKQIAESILTPRPREDSDQLTGPTRPTPVVVAPAIDSVTPQQVVKDTHPATLTVIGSGFIPDSKVLIDDQERPTKPASATELTVELAPEDVADVGIKGVTVDNGSEGGSSESSPIEITA